MKATGSAPLDTTIVVDHLRRKSPALDERFKETTTLYLPVTALGELLYGAYKSAFEAKGLRQIEDFIQLCAILGPGERTSSLLWANQCRHGSARKADSAKRYLDCRNSART
jgi:predicted nucleic acid-binding protein